MGANNSADKRVVVDERGLEERPELFEKMHTRFAAVDPNLARQLGGIYLFCIMKKQMVKYWTMDLNKVKIYEGEPEDDQDPDATITLTEETLLQLATGKSEVRNVVQSGKCSVTGDIMRVMQLEPYMKI